MIAEQVDLCAKLEDVDLVVTGEGAINSQTASGKVPGEVARLAKARGIPVIAVAGMLGQGHEELYSLGIESMHSLCSDTITSQQSIAQAPALLKACASRIARTAPVDPRDALDDLGRQLLRLNVDALAGRYPTAPHVEEERQAAAYTFTARPETAGYALRQLDCYLYQIGEGDVCERPLALALGKVRRILADRVLDDVPSYAAAPWGVR